MRALDGDASATPPASRARTVSWAAARPRPTRPASPFLCWRRATGLARWTVCDDGRRWRWAVRVWPAGCGRARWILWWAGRCGSDRGPSSAASPNAVDGGVQTGARIRRGTCRLPPRSLLHPAAADDDRPRHVALCARRRLFACRSQPPLAAQVRRVLLQPASSTNPRSRCRLAPSARPLAPRACASRSPRPSSSADPSPCPKRPRASAPYRPAPSACSSPFYTSSTHAARGPAVVSGVHNAIDLDLPPIHPRARPIGNIHIAQGVSLR